MDLYNYSYVPKNVVINVDGENLYVRDGSVNYITMIHDYLNRKMPVFSMGIELDIPTIAAIYEAGQKAYISFNLYEYQKDAEATIINTSLYMQHRFTIIPARDQSEYITSTDSISKIHIDEMRSLQFFELYMVDMNAVKWFTQQLCTVFDEVSKAGVLQALFEMRSVPNGITIASPPMDNNKVSNVIIPLGDLIGNIEVLNGQYGLYNVKPWVYYDFTNLYCINWLKPNIILKSADDFSNIMIMVLNQNYPDKLVTGSFTDMQSQTHIMSVTDEPQIYDISKQQGSTKFSTVTSVNKDGNVNKNTVDDKHTALTYVYAKNDLTVDQMVNENMTGHTVSISSANCALSFIKPYKSVTFKVDSQYMDQGLEGHPYRIDRWTTSITREGNGIDANYTHTVNMTLHEIKAKNK